MNRLPAVDLRAVREEDVTLESLFAVLKQRRRIFFGVLAAFLVLVTLYCAMATRRYQAAGQIQIQKETVGSFGLDESVMGDAAGQASDALDYNVTLQTEANILGSDSLALQVIKELHLEATHDFFPSAKSNPARGMFSHLFFWKKPIEPLTVPIDQAPDRRYAALRIFASHLKIEPVTGTRLINVSYSNPDPRLAADVVNHLVSALMEYSYQSRFAATAQASTWLSAQLDGLRRQTEGLQAKATALERDTGMYGDDASHNVVLARLESLNQALAEAESNRILKESIYQAASSGDPELISGLTVNTSSGPSIANSLGLIQNLRAQQTNIKAELDEDKVRYGPAYPRIAELQAEWNSVEKAIHDEVHRVGERARTDYEIAKQAESSARAAFEKQKKLASDLNSKTVAFALAKQEADGSRQVYENLLAKLKQAGVLEGLRSTNITVVNPARVPPPNHPKSPNVFLYYAAAIGMGLFAGTASAFAQHMADSKVRSLENAEKMIGAPLLGLVPAIGGRTTGKRSRLLSPPAKQAITTHYVDTLFSESLRTLRTSLMLSRSSAPPQVLLITSPGAGEGKSTISLELATVLAQQGARVLLIEADLRRPVLSQRMGIQNEISLSSALSNQACFPTPEKIQNVPALSVLCSGDTPPFPAELLGSPRMQNLLSQWKRQYDFIVLDGPPVLPVTDAIVLSQRCDAVLLVSRYGQTERKALKRSYEALLRQAPCGVIVGAVLNAVPERSSDFYDYYGYRGYSYGAEKKHNEALA
jgi:capsular exopolysaccharide synthesis family protein